MKLGGKHFLDCSGGFGQKRAVIYHACGMDNGMDRAMGGRDLRDCIRHFGRIGHIGGQHEHLAAQGFQALQRQNAAAGGIRWAMRGQMRRPILARGQGAAGDQRDLGGVIGDKGLGQRQANTAETTCQQNGGPLGCCQRGFRQGHLFHAPLQSLGAPQGGGDIGGGGEEVFEHLRRQRGKIRLAAPHGGQHHVQTGASYPRHFARDHFGRPRDGCLFRVRQCLSTHLNGTAGQHGDIWRLGKVFLSQGLPQEHQGIEPLLDIAVEEAGAGAEAFARRHQPEMRNSVGRLALGHQIAQKLVIAIAAAFGRKLITAPAIGAERIAGTHGNNRVARRTQWRSTGLGQPGLIHEHQPDQRVGALQPRLKIDLGFRCAGPPDRLPAPACQIIHPHRQVRRGGSGLARRDVILLALESIGGQRHALARGIAPDWRPISVHATGPEPPDRGDMPLVIGDHLFRVAQRRDNLTGRHTIGLRQR